MNLQTLTKHGRIKRTLSDNHSGGDNSTDRVGGCLICSLLYAMDKVANTVGHYDAFRKKLDMLRPVKLLIPDIDYSRNQNNEVYREDANMLIKKSLAMFYTSIPLIIHDNIPMLIIF